MKNLRIYISMGLAVPAWAFFCWLAPAAAAGETDTSAAPKKVVASLFPQYDFARRVGGARATASMLLPPGSESHSYEPTPSDMKRIADADLFIYTGDYMEPWAGRVAAAAGRPGGVTVVDASRGVRLRPGDDEDDDHDHADHHKGEGHFHEFDPHIWLDPVLAMAMVDNIADAMAERDPENAEYYRGNAESLKNELNTLHEDFRALVAASPRRTLVFGERFAFAYFFSRYGLEEVGPYNSCAPGAEPGLKAVIDTVNYVREHGIPTIYREGQAASRISRVIAEETGVVILVVDSLHNPTADQLKAGYNYLDAMRVNMEAFAKGLQ